MSEGKNLQNLIDGAEACIRNAKRLLKDAKSLIASGGHLTSFVISQFGIEELAKAHILIDKHKNKNVLSKKEWSNLTKGSKGRKGRSAHEIKIEHFLRKEEELNREQIGPMYQNAVEKMMAARGFENPDKYYDEVSKMFYKAKLDILFVDYDFENKKWKEPTDTPHSDRISMHPGYSINSYARAVRFLEYLEATLKSIKQERE